MRMLIGAMLVLTGLAQTALAQNYPNRQPRIILTTTPGTPLDVATRLIGNKLSALWGQAVVVENRPGGNLTIGTQAVVTAPPDGYTVLGAQGSLTQSAALHGKDLPYDVLTDLAPITQLHSVQIFYVVDGRLPARTLGEFIALARANPGKFTFASYGFGTTAHLLALKLNRDAKIDLVHVPYQGTAAALQAILSGDASAAMAEMASIRQFISDGRLRVIAVTGAKRSPFAPEIPTFEESGVSGFEVKSWAGWFAPRATSEAVVHKIANDVSTVLTTPEVQAYYRNLTSEPIGNSPEEFRGIMKHEVEYWTSVVNASNLKDK
jgi:tripartite-type tricarboxylate transporter receptor subunit TctC